MTPSATRTVGHRNWNRRVNPPAHFFMVSVEPLSEKQRTWLRLAGVSKTTLMTRRLREGLNDI